MYCIMAKTLFHQLLQVIWCLFLCLTVVRCSNYEVHYFTTPNEKLDLVIGDPQDNLFIFCYNGEGRNWLNVWKSICIQLHFQNEKYELFQGTNETEVEYSYRESYSLFHLMPWKTKFADLDVFEKSCVGVNSEQKFSATLEVNYINFWKILRLVCGLVLYFAAQPLSSNLVFYYSSGVLLGITASLLIIVFVLSRLIPRKVGAVSVLFGGWAVVLYVIQLFFSNIKTVAAQHQTYVVAYVVCVGFVSFAICYRYGTVDQRTRNLIKWVLQGIGLLLIFLSTEWREVSTSIILIVITMYNFPAKWKSKLRTVWRRRFPAKIKLLTEEDYHKQSAEETKKALEELRKYCSSPKCESWKLMQKLKTPLRFAEFVEGNSHLSDAEILDYEISNDESLIDGVETSDEDSVYDEHATVI